MYDSSVKRYFSTFGPCKVTTVQVPNDILRHIDISDVYTNWYIHYANIEDAGRALDRSEHSINRKKIMVEAAESWLQYEAPDPTARMKVLSKQAAECEDDDKTTKNIGNLNPDCWEEICKHLNLADLCAVADTCLAAHEGASRIAKKRMEVVQFTFTMYTNTLLNTRAMAIFGDSVANIVVQSHLKHSSTEFALKAKYFHDLINCYGPNVRTLRWPHGDIARQIQFDQLKQLKEIYIDCDYLLWNNAATIKCLDTVEKMEMGNVTFSDAIWWTMQYRMKRLHSLHVHQSIGFDMSRLSGMQMLKNLWLHVYDRKAVLAHVASLRDLEFLCLHKSGGLIDTTEYMQLVKDYRQSGRQLTIHNHTCCISPTIDKSLLEANKQYVDLVFKGHAAEQNAEN